MKVKYVKNNEIDKYRWDELLEHSYNGIIYGYSWYLDIVADNWDALIDENFEYVFPIVWRKKYGIKYIYQPFFTQQLGLFSRKIITPEIVSIFCNSIPKEFRLIEMQINTFNILDNSNFKVIKRSTYELDLILQYETLAKSFSVNVIRNYKKSLAEPCTFSINLDPIKLIKLFIADKSQEIHSLKMLDYKKLNQLMNAVITRGVGQVWGVYDKTHELSGGALFVESNGKIIFLFSATTEVARKHGGMFFIINEFLKLNAGRNITLDFEGSDMPGLARFYSSFGAKRMEYSFIKMNKLPFFFKILKK